MPYYSVISDLRVREVNLVYEYTHSLNEKCFSKVLCDTYIDLSRLSQTSE
jgi:hypothetical protein